MILPPWSSKFLHLHGMCLVLDVPLFGERQKDPVDDPSFQPLTPSRPYHVYLILLHKLLAASSCDSPYRRSCNSCHKSGISIDVFINGQTQIHRVVVHVQKTSPTTGYETPARHKNLCLKLWLLLESSTVLLFCIRIIDSFASRSLGVTRLLAIFAWTRIR